MSSKCKDPNYILITPECKNTNVDTYNNYIKQMNLYCSKDDNAIANPNCIDYINNNKFIQTTDFNKEFKKKAIDLCLNNLNPLYDSNCINSYNTKPLEIIRQEEKKIQLAKDAETKKNLMWFVIGLSIFVLLFGGGYLLYKKRKKDISTPLEEGRNKYRNMRKYEKI